MDTAEGFPAAHGRERRLAAAASRPSRGRARSVAASATLIEWLLFEQEYYASGAPGRANQNGLSLLAPTLMARQRPSAERFLTADGARRREDLGAGLVETEAGSDLAGLKSLPSGSTAARH